MRLSYLTSFFYYYLFWGISIAIIIVINNNLTFFFFFLGRGSGSAHYDYLANHFSSEMYI